MGVEVAETALDDVFIDDISFPATDGYPLGASLYLPRGARRHAVLISSATAVPRKIYKGFASYLASRGCAVLTYDYRGIGDSRLRAPVSRNQPRSLVGFEVSMSEWAARDVTAAVAWMRERYQALPLSYVGHSFGGQALGLLPNNTEVSRALLIAAQAARWRLMASPERYRVYVLMNFVGTPLHPTVRLCAGLERDQRGFAKGRLPAMGPLGDEPALYVRRPQTSGAGQFCKLPGSAPCAAPFRRSVGGRGPRLSYCVRDLPRRRPTSPPSRRPMRVRPRLATSASSGRNIATRCGGTPRNGCWRQNNYSAASRTWRAVGVRMVTSSSAAVGCSAMVASKSALVAFILTAIPITCTSSAASGPTM
jgi:pimeloyl-ACP methyl ester carboxylesterase